MSMNQKENRSAVITPNKAIKNDANAVAQFVL